jgi:acyltransferase
MSDGLATGASREGARGAPRGAGNRWVALDLLRFVAVFLMVQGHTFTELLDPAYHEARWFRHHTFVHGYTAPMFLFASGLAFGYTTFRAWDTHASGGDALWKRLRRYGWLLAIGYLIHVPTLAVAGLVAPPEHALRAWLQVDVLQHIAVSLAVLSFLVVAAKKPGRFIAVVSVLFVLTVFLAPIVWRVPTAQTLPLGLAGYVNGGSGSYFPLVPWAGFTYAGVMIAWLARNEVRPSHRLATWLLGITTVTIVVPILVNRTGWNPYGVHDFWRTSPYYFLFRLGNVTGVLTVLCFLERWADRRALVLVPGSYADRAMSAVRVVGQESLVIYVAHLVALHGWVVGPGLAAQVGGQLSLMGASIVALLLFVSMIFVARAWSEWTKGELRFQALQLSAAGAFAYLLLIAR